MDSINISRPLVTCLALAALLIALSSCVDTVAKASDIEISGIVQAGRVRSSTVSVRDVVNGVPADVIATTLTNAAGRFRMKVPKPPTPRLLVIEATGGDYEDEASGEIVPLGRTLCTVVTTMEDSPGDLPVSPLTSVAVELAAQGPDGITTETVTAAFENVNSWIGNVFDVANTVPADPLKEDSGASASAAENDYALALAGLSRLADDLDIAPDDFLDRMVDDASDGVLDGERDTTPVFDDPDTLTVRFAGAITDFAGSERNKGGATPSAGLTGAVATFTDRLHPGGPPVITEVTPSSGPSSGGTETTIKGHRFFKNVVYVVRFGSSPATDIVWHNATTLTCLTPAGTAGAVVDVSITGDNGSDMLESGFTYGDADKSRWGSMRWGQDAWSAKE